MQFPVSQSLIGVESVHEKVRQGIGVYSLPREEFTFLILYYGHLLADGCSRVGSISVKRLRIKKENNPIGVEPSIGPDNSPKSATQI